MTCPLSHLVNHLSVLLLLLTETESTTMLFTEYTRALRGTRSVVLLLLLMAVSLNRCGGKQQWPRLPIV